MDQLVIWKRSGQFYCLFVSNRYICSDLTVVLRFSDPHLTFQSTNYNNFPKFGEIPAQKQQASGNQFLESTK